MSAEAAIVAQSWRVGRYTCTLTVPRVRDGSAAFCSLEWEPEQPRKLTPGEIAEYRAGRNAAIAELAADLGINVAVLDL